MDENNYIVNLAAVEHSMVDRGEREGLEQRFNGPSNVHGLLICFILIRRHSQMFVCIYQRQLIL